MRFIYTFTLSAPSEANVRRMAHVTVNDGPENVTEVTGDQFELAVSLDDTISVSFTDTDSAGNASDPAVVFSGFVVTDTVPPNTPMVSVQVRQVSESDLPVEPPVETPPTEEDNPPSGDDGQEGGEESQS